MDASAALLSYVHKALVAKAKGTDGTSYNNLVKELSSMRKKLEKPNGSQDLATSQLLSNTIVAITGNVSSLRERKHDSLMNEVLGIKIWSCQPVVRESIMELMVHMILSNASFTHTCLQLLVYSLVPPPAPPLAEQEPEAPWKASELSLSVQSQVISTLERVAELVPTSLPKILQLIAQGLPHKLRDRDSQCLFVSAMLQLAEGKAGTTGGIREGLLSSIIDHLLSIDVEIRWEDIVDVPMGKEGEEEASEGEDQGDIFELEGMSELEISAAGGLEEAVRRRREQAEDRGGWEGQRKRSARNDSAAPSEGPSPSPSRPPVDEMANKLDSLMELLFDYLSSRRAQEAEGGGVGSTWACLLSSFERSILPTSRSKFTQYLLFHYSSLDPAPSCSSFLSLLLERLIEERQPEVTRVACAAYLASFVARAAFLPTPLLLHCLTRLIDYACSYSNRFHTQSAHNSSLTLPRPSSLNGTIGAAAGPSSANRVFQGGLLDPSQHLVFYATVQATLYILCYHMRALAGSQDVSLANATKQLLCEKLLPMLFQGTPGLGGVKGGPCLHPLAICLESVVLEFRSQVLSLGIESASPPPQAPGQSTLSTPGQSTLSALFKSALSLSADRPQRPLEMFFPFDPYLLKRSSKHLKLKDNYIRWTRGRPSTLKALVVSSKKKGGGSRGGQAEGYAAGISPPSDLLHGGSEGDEEDEDEDLDDDDDDDEEEEEGGEGGDGHVMGDSSVYDESSDDELEGMSLPSDSILSRPGIFKRNNNDHHHHHQGAAEGQETSRGGSRAQARGSDGRPGSHPHHSHRPPKHPQAAAEEGGGAGSPRPRPHPRLYENVNHEAMMGVSYGTRMTPSSMGESPPTGTSPVLVNYLEGVIASSASQGGSPMLLGTPAFSHMDSAARLGQKLR